MDTANLDDLHFGVGAVQDVEVMKVSTRRTENNDAVALSRDHVELLAEHVGWRQKLMQFLREDFQDLRDLAPVDLVGHDPEHGLYGTFYARESGRKVVANMVKKCRQVGVGSIGPGPT